MTLRKLLLTNDLNESTVEELDFEKLVKLLKKYRYTEDSISVWRRPAKGYTNIAIALSKDVYLYYYGNDDKISLKINPTKVTIANDYAKIGFQELITIYNSTWKSCPISKRSEFYSLALKILKDILEENVSGEEYVNGKVVNYLVNSKKYKDMNF